MQEYVNQNNNEKIIIYFDFQKKKKIRLLLHNIMI